MKSATFPETDPGKMLNTYLNKLQKYDPVQVNKPYSLLHKFSG